MTEIEDTLIYKFLLKTNKGANPESVKRTLAFLERLKTLRPEDLTISPEAAAEIEECAQRQIKAMRKGTGLRTKIIYTKNQKGYLERNVVYI